MRPFPFPRLRGQLLNSHPLDPGPPRLHLSFLPPKREKRVWGLKILRGEALGSAEAGGEGGGCFLSAPHLQAIHPPSHRLRPGAGPVRGPQTPHSSGRRPRPRPGAHGPGLPPSSGGATERPSFSAEAAGCGNLELPRLLREGAGGRPVLPHRAAPLRPQHPSLSARPAAPGGRRRREGAPTAAGSLG